MIDFIKLELILRIMNSPFRLKIVFLQFLNCFRCSNDGSKSVHSPRYVCIETKKCSNLGISLVGGNAVGIFVHSVQVDSRAYNAGLRTGDQILECRGADLRQATAEEAAYELAKPADKVTILALFNIDREYCSVFSLGKCPKIRFK